MPETDDLSSPRVIDRPYEYFGELRETEPVYRNERWGGWIVTRYDDVVRCLQDDDNLSTWEEAKRLKSMRHEMPTTKEMFPKWISYLDPPEHDDLRKAINEVFNPDVVRGQQEEAEEITNSLIAEVQEENPDRIDLIDDFAYPLPVRIISQIMGLPSEKEEQLGRWSYDMSATLFYKYGVENRFAKTEKAVKEFSSYLETIVQEKKEDPQDDLLTDLLEVKVSGRELTDNEVIATAMLFLFGGHETTTKLIGNGVIALLNHPEQFDKLQTDNSHLKSAVEEMLRYNGPSISVTRGVVENFTLRDKQIERGDKLLLSLGAANHDPRHFDDPDHFDIQRGSYDHVGFGQGTHYCIGAPLARLETRVAISSLVENFPNMELATDEINWTQSWMVRGPKELPLRVNL